MKADAILREKGVVIEDAFKSIYPELPNHIKWDQREQIVRQVKSSLKRSRLLHFRVNIIKPALLKPPKEVEVIDETHPLWNSRKCHIYGDTNVLVTGMPQAQVLTKTVCVDGLPQTLQTRIDGIELTRETDRSMKNAILAAHLFDAEQKPLEKLKDPLRPAWNFPRVYGITRQRKK